MGGRHGLKESPTRHSQEVAMEKLHTQGRGTEWATSSKHFSLGSKVASYGHARAIST